MKKDTSQLEPNPEMPGWYRGFVVVNTTTNQVHDIYPGLLEAHQEAKRLGAPFRSYGGGYCPESGEFKYFKGVLED